MSSFSSHSSASSSKLIHLTNQFWRALVLGNFTELEDMLDCECCAMESFDDMLGATTGIFVTLERLKDVASKIKANKLETNVHTLKIMQNQCQSRMLIHSKGTIISSHVGIALNWVEDKVTWLIIMKNADEATFFVDDTTPSVEYMKAKSLLDDSADMKRLSLVDLEAELQPPYLCPKPPSIPATVNIIVLSCSNLKSRLRRVIERSVDAYVIVIVNGHERSTEVVTDTNPWFDATNNFLFELPAEFKNADPEHAVITFRVMDKIKFGEDIELSRAVLPLASLPAQVDNHSPSDITLPLQLQSKVGFFGVEYPQNNIDDEVPLLKVRVSKVDALEWWLKEEMHQREEAQERELVEKAHAKKSRNHRSATSSVPCVESNNVDPIEHSGSKEGGEKAKRKGSWTARMGFGGGHRKKQEEDGGGRRSKEGLENDEHSERRMSEVDIRPIMTMCSRDEWVDSKHVVICMGCLANFTVRKRKHHCRSCGEVFCQNCSSKKVKIERDNVRVCDRCLSTKRVSGAILSIERDSVLMPDGRGSDETCDYDYIN